MNRILKFAGFTGIGCGLLFYTLMMLRLIFDLPGPPDEFFAAIMIGGLMCFAGCLILSLNEIATQLKRKNDARN